MATIAVDIDDTLYGFCDLARRVLTEEGFRTGDEKLISAAYAPWPEWRSPVDLLGLDEWLRIIALCHDDEKIEDQIPYDYAPEVLAEAVASGHELLYISNRATETEGATRRWLDAWFPEGELIVTSEDKKPYVAHCQYLIDDRPKTIIQFLFDRDWPDQGSQDDNRRRVFSLSKEFNRGLTDVPHVYLAPTWYGIRHYLIGKGLISPEVTV
jgi:hypothetical protein